MHSMNKMWGKTSFVAIKVDLAKAYDGLKWSFMLKLLREIGLPHNIINIIMNY